MITITILLIVSLLILPADKTRASDMTMIDRLASLDGVLHVEAVGGNMSGWMPEKYILTFLQPLDWSDPEAGFYPQRVEIGLHPGATVTVMDTYGYNLSEGQFPRDDEPELCHILGANYVKIEHRFSGASCPEGMTNTGSEGWQYATSYNESCDYHQIFHVLSQVIGGNWICYGRSRGGRACLDYARSFPDDDIKGYVAYVGVNCNSDTDPRMAGFLATEVGDSAFGPDTGARMRTIVSDFQVELMRHKEEFARRLWDTLETAGMLYVEGMTGNRIFDISLYEFPIGLWMDGDHTGELEQILWMPEETDEEYETKLNAEYNLLTKYGNPATFSYSSFVWPFYACCLKWEGMYDYDFSWLRNTLEAAGLQDKLDVTAQAQSDYLRNFVLSDEQQEVFRFTPGHYEALDGWAKETTANVLFIGGDLDPWSAVYIDGGDNPNFRTYICSGQSHHVQIANFDPDTQNEIVETLYSWLQ